MSPRSERHKRILKLRQLAEQRALGNKYLAKIKEEENRDGSPYLTIKQKQQFADLYNLKGADWDPKLLEEMIGKLALILFHQRPHIRAIERWAQADFSDKGAYPHVSTRKNRYKNRKPRNPARDARTLQVVRVLDPQTCSYSTHLTIQYLIKHNLLYCMWFDIGYRVKAEKY